MVGWFNFLRSHFLGPKSAKDNIWGWVVVSAGFVINMSTCGFQMTFGLVYTSILRDLRSSKGEAAFVSTIMTAMLFLLGPAASIVSDRIGLRNTVWLGSICLGLSLFLTSLSNSIEGMYVTFGLLTGASAAFVVTPCPPMVTHYFQKKTKVALGILSTGIPFASVALTPIYAYILKRCGWRILFQILSIAMTLILLSAGLTFIPTTDEMRYKMEIRSANKSKKLDKYKRLIRSPRTLVLLVSMSLNTLACNSFNVHLVELCLEYGIPWHKASIIPILLGLGSITGRLLTGALNSLGVISALTTYQLCNFLNSVTCIVGSFATNFRELASLAFIYMVLDGASLGVQALPILEITGPEYFQQAWSLNCGMQAIFLMFPAPIVGWIVDKTHDYRYLMYWTAWPCLLTAVMLMTLQFDCFTCLQRSVSDTISENLKQENIGPCEENILIEPETCM